MAIYKVEICGVNTASLPLLKASEKDELLKKALNGDQNARDLYIKGNLRLVLSVIQRFSGNGENVDGEKFIFNSIQEYASYLEKIYKKPFDLYGFLKQFTPKKFVYGENNNFIYLNHEYNSYDSGIIHQYEAPTVYFTNDDQEKIVLKLNEESVRFEDYKKTIKLLGWL